MAHTRLLTPALVSSRRLALALALVAVVASVLAVAPVEAGAASGERKARLVAEREAAQRRAAAAEGAIAAAAAAHEAALTRYDAAYEAYTGHLVALYEAGELARIEAISSVESVGDAADAAMVINQLARHDAALLSEFRDAGRAVEVTDRALVDAYAAAGRASSEVAQINEAVERYAEPAAVSNLAADRGPAPLAEHFFTTTPIPGLSLGLASPLLPALPGTTVPPLAGGAQPPPPGLAPTGQIEVGEASWYGPGFHGNNTASGEVYDQYAMTAAHKTLPFGTWVRVSTADGRAVFVRINDRGPFVAGRIIDLSYAAAQQLGMGGTAPVQVEVWAAPGANQ